MPRKRRILPKRTRQLRTQTRTREELVARSERLFLTQWRLAEYEAFRIVELWLAQNGYTLATADALGKDWSIVLRKIDELFREPKDWRALFGRMAAQVDQEVTSNLVQTIPRLDRKRLLPSGHVGRYAERNADLITNVSGLLKRQVSEFFGAAEPGAHVKALTEQLQAKFDIGESRARLWARDQTLKLHSDITEERHRAVGISRYLWTDSSDERVRERHAELGDMSDAGTSFAYDDPPRISEDGAPERFGNPGDDYQCLPGYTQIAFTSPVRGSFRRWYDGELTALVTDSGETLEATPNHPVLTTAGWKAPEQVEIGDYLIRAREYGAHAAKAQVQDRVPEIAEVHQALSLVFGISRQRGIATQFHNDGIVDQKIYVVNVERGLLSDFKATSAQDLCEFRFAFARAPALAARYRDLVFQALGLPSDCAVSALRLRLACFFAGLGEASDVSLRAPADFDPVAFQSALDRCAGNAVAFSGLFDRCAGNVRAQAHLLREWLCVVRASVHATRFRLDANELTQVVGIAPKPRRYLLPSLTAYAEPARVVQKFRRVFSGHVYNLTTDDAWYVANDLAVHNCRCTAFPVLD